MRRLSFDGADVGPVVDVGVTVAGKWRGWANWWRPGCRRGCLVQRCLSPPSQMDMCRDLIDWNLGAGVGLTLCTLNS